jgi:hypothetical protein
VVEERQIAQLLEAQVLLVKVLQAACLRLLPKVLVLVVVVLGLLVLVLLVLQTILVVEAVQDFVQPSLAQEFFTLVVVLGLVMLG